MKKKLLSLILVTTMLFLTACGNPQTNEEASKNDFKFLSISWGEDWETVQKLEVFNEAEMEVTKEDALGTIVSVKNVKFFEKTVEAILRFGSEKSDAEGLYEVTVQFQESDEADILTQMTEIYGELQTSYPDKDGIPNPIEPAGWYKEERVDDVLTQEEKEEIAEPIIKKGLGDSFVDAILRKPMVTIYFDQEANTLRYHSYEAAVKTLRK